MWIHLQEFSHDFTIFFTALNSHMNSYYDFIYDFIIMNSMASLAWIHEWIHKSEFWHKISWVTIFTLSRMHVWNHFMNSHWHKISWSWIHMLYFITYEFISEFMYMKNSSWSEGAAYTAWISEIKIKRKGIFLKSVTAV